MKKFKLIFSFLQLLTMFILYPAISTEIDNINIEDISKNRKINNSKYQSVQESYNNNRIYLDKERGKTFNLLKYNEEEYSVFIENKKEYKKDGWRGADIIGGNSIKFDSDFVSTNYDTEKILVTEDGKTYKILDENSSLLSSILSSKRRTVLSDQDACIYPNNLVVRLDLFYSYKGAIRQYRGTGFLREHTILTAAHNLFDCELGEVIKIDIHFAGKKSCVARGFRYSDTYRNLDEQYDMLYTKNGMPTPDNEYLNLRSHDYGLIWWWPEEGRSITIDDYKNEEFLPISLQNNIKKINSSLYLPGYPLEKDIISIIMQKNWYSMLYLIDIFWKITTTQLHYDHSNSHIINTTNNEILNHTASSSGGQSGSPILKERIKNKKKPVKVFAIHVAGGTRFGSNLGNILTQSKIDNIDKLSLEFLLSCIQNP